MTEAGPSLPPEEEPAPEWADERRFVDERIQSGVETIGALWIFALIPIMLIYLLVRLIIGDAVRYFGWLYYLIPVAPIAAIFLVPVWHRWRSPMPLHPRGKAVLTEAQKRRELVKWAIIISFLGCVAMYGPLLEQRLLFTVRDWLMAWRI